MINEDKIREVWASNPERGFKLLIDFFQQPIYWHIRRLVVSHEDAEDILQEVFIRVFRHLPQFREESSLGTWIYRIATNRVPRQGGKYSVLFRFLGGCFGGRSSGRVNE